MWPENLRTLVDVERRKKVKRYVGLWGYKAQKMPLTQFMSVMGQLLIDLPQIDTAVVTISEPESTGSDAGWRARIGVPIVDPSSVLIEAAKSSDAVTYEQRTSRLIYDCGPFKARTAAKARQQVEQHVRAWLKHLEAQLQSLESYNENLSSVIKMDIEDALTEIKFGR